MKGQNLRVLINGKCIAAATSCTFNVDVQTEQENTKDNVKMFDMYAVTGKGWNVSCDALFDPSKEDASAITPADLAALIIENDNPEVTLKWETTSGDDCRTEAGWGYTGKAIYTSMGVTAGVRSTVTGSHSFQGNGALTPIHRS